MTALVTLRWLIITAAFYIVDLAAGDVPNKYVGLQVPPLPNGHKHTEGFLLDDRATSYYGIARITHDDGEVIWLEKLLYHDEEGEPHWEIISAIVESKLEEGDTYFLGTCMEDGMHRRELIALVKLEDKEDQTAIKRAWQVDLNRETIEQRSVAGITCYIEGWAHH